MFVLNCDKMDRVLNALPKYNLFGLNNSSYENARVVVLPVPYDSTSSYRAGSRDAPHAIIDASRNLELYSEELDGDISKTGIYTLEELAPHMGSPEAMVERVEKEINIILDDDKMPLILGGEHTVALGAIKALAHKHKDFSVVSFDAHSDSREELFSTKYSHACVMARARESCKSCYTVGVRSTDKPSKEKYGKQMLFMKDIRKMNAGGIAKKIIENTARNIYITFDFDVIDPSEMPSVGTPEPDGLHFAELTEILRGVLENKKLLGLDFTELNPIAGLIAPNYLAAKLIYLTLGYAYRANK